MSDAPQTLDDAVSEDVRVITHFDVASGRWTSTVVGGPIDGWSMICRDDEDVAGQHAKVIAAAKAA